MSTSVRFVRRGVQGTVRQNFNMPNIIKSAQAVVHMSAGEISQGPRTQVGNIAQDFIYNLGSAPVWVSNVSPHFNSHFGGEVGGVEFLLHVDHNRPIDVAITITVEDNTPVEIQN
jgi:hypothetical protein